MQRQNKKDEERQKKIAKYNVVLVVLNIVIAIIQIVEKLLILFFK
ncbi:hypothetical protein [Staphylococcus saprophyticus]|nr:hypothetical protein [Staphylococcus saprophyticus]